jgi:hypothetical protein
MKIRKLSRKKFYIIGPWSAKIALRNRKGECDIIDGQQRN